MAKAILKTAGDRAFLHFQGEIVPALIGRYGLSLDKTEGDLRTPVGELPLRRILYRADRTLRPVSGAGLPVKPITPNDGWCDDPTHPDYNRAVTLPHPASCENLWRDDHAYDLCIVMGWNDAPAESGRGSAIFLHLPPASGNTEGCIALDEKDLRAFLKAGLSHITVETPA
ncbi:L,D-transpeptidase family protein [Gluconobacter sp. LMG 31484]|uniref:L,D-transpeptidase family protein n=1 Tax=Gluconobacter vitians TaxID=2728102 RepID=A0ABR9Y5X3_9PROT|nr:L,D-transpeptidase family protein [Gluconobacter vitians]MBF0859328.1 L,D-transpeptidase family protein [Gluconobacter vitians]